MDRQRKTLRVGAAAILCALVFRAFSAGLPERAAAWLTQPNTAAFLTYLETGRIVRFSASQEVFSDFFGESPPPQTQPAPPAETLPAFSAEDAAAIDVYYACSLRPDLGALLSKPLDWDLTGNAPTVLILHTHTTESYTKSGESYTESAAYRTLDEAYNMLSIGDRVAQRLTEAGIPVLHDRELHDYPSYNGSYVHARKSIQQYLEQYPTIRLVLDLHRDAAESGGGQLRTLASVEGEDCAQLMLVMGTNAAGLSHDNWQENLSLALKLQAQLEAQAPGITRPLCLRSQRFNQDLSPGALLVEVGAAGNTHDEALRAADQLAEAILALSHGTQ